MGCARLAETGGLQWPSTDARPDGTVRLYKDRAFPTAWTVSESFEKDIDTGHEHTMRETERGGPPRSRAVFVPKDYEPSLDSTDGEFPMVATTGRQVYHWQTRSKSARSPWLHEAAPGVFLSLTVGMRSGSALLTATPSESSRGAGAWSRRNPATTPEVSTDRVL